MSARAPSFDFRLIDTPAGSLPCIVRGPLAGPQLLIIPPLFEEMNRTRALLAGVGRDLAARGIGSWLPDLPGTGDSDLSLSEISWQQWQNSLLSLSELIYATSGRETHILSIRGGSLLGGSIAARSRYRLAPVASGERVLRELLRARLAADQERAKPTTAADLERRLQTETVELAGYPITPSLAADLRRAALPDTPATRTVGVAGSTGDRVLDGPPLWRHAEPAAAPALAGALTDDLADWIASCDAR